MADTNYIRMEILDNIETISNLFQFTEVTNKNLLSPMINFIRKNLSV